MMLAACAPTTPTRTPSSSGGSKLLQPGQTWLVQVQRADGRRTTFTIVLDQPPITKASGVTLYVDPKDVSGANRLLTGLTYDPLDADPEFLLAVRETVVEGTKSRESCIVLNPSVAPDPTAFAGRYATSPAASEKYVTRGQTEGLGACTLILSSPQK